MVKSFAQPIVHAEFLADGRTLRLSDKLARNISRQTAKVAALEAALNAPRPVGLAQLPASSNSNPLVLSIRPAQLRALKFDDAMFHSILHAISQQDIVLDNSSSKPVHVLRHDVLRNLLHAKMETGWYTGKNVAAKQSMKNVDTLAEINVSSIATGSSPLKVRSVNGQSLDLTGLLGEIISRFISPAQVSLDITDQYCWEQDTSSAAVGVHCTALELSCSSKRAVSKELGSKHESAYGTAPMIFLQGMENGPPLKAYSSKSGRTFWRV